MKFPKNFEDKVIKEIMDDSRIHSPFHRFRDHRFHVPEDGLIKVKPMTNEKEIMDALINAECSDATCTRTVEANVTSYGNATLSFQASKGDGEWHEMPLISFCLPNIHFGPDELFERDKAEYQPPTLLSQQAGNILFRLFEPAPKIKNIKRKERFMMQFKVDFFAPVSDREDIMKALRIGACGI